MNDTELRRSIALCDQGLGGCPCGCEDCDDQSDRRVSLKREQLAMWIKTYGTAE